MVRRLPRWRLMLMVSHDEIDDEQSVAFSLMPEGLGSTPPLFPLYPGRRD